MPRYAVKETKTIQTKNDTSLIDQMNKREELFFWNVQSVQVTHVQDSHTEFRDKAFMNEIEVTTVTETTQYATITYERDKMIPLYDEVVAMEKEYCDMEDTIRRTLDGKKYPRVILGLIIIIALVGIIGALSVTLANIASVLIVPYLAYVVYIRTVYNRKIDQQVKNELFPKLEQKEAKARALYSHVIRAMQAQ